MVTLPMLKITTKKTRPAAPKKTGARPGKARKPAVRLFARPVEGESRPKPGPSPAGEKNHAEIARLKKQRAKLSTSIAPRVAAGAGKPELKQLYQDINAITAQVAALETGHGEAPPEQPAKTGAGPSKPELRAKKKILMQRAKRMADNLASGKPAKEAKRLEWAQKLDKANAELKAVADLLESMKDG